MKAKIVVLLIAVFLPRFCLAADDVESLFNKALEHLVKNGYAGDTSTAERYLEAVLEHEPNHLEAIWLRLLLKLPSRNSRLIERPASLSAIGTEFKRLAKLAKEAKKTAFLHYITARHAEAYDAYDRALSEIDKALVLEPTSARYLFTKGRLLVDYGSAIKQDREIENGISLVRKAKELAKKYPNRFARDADYDFEIAHAISTLHKGRWDEVVEYYRRFIEQSESSLVYAFAWNNMSIAYRHLGECDKAKEAAEKAIKVTKFGAAEWNRRIAEFCIEMQKMGLAQKKEGS